MSTRASAIEQATMLMAALPVAIMGTLWISFALIEMASAVA
jgi:hypothetical protein